MNRRYFYGILFLLGALLMPSCKDKTLDMTVLTKTLYEDAVIDEFHVEDAWQVTIVQDSSKKGVELEYSAFLEEFLKIVKEGSALDIAFTQRLNLPSQTVKNATVYVPSLRKLVLEEEASAALQGEFYGNKLEVTQKDKSTLRGGSYFGSLTMALSDASKVVDFTVAGDSCGMSLEDASVFKGTLTASTLLDLQIKDESRLTTYGGNTPTTIINMSNKAFLNMTQTVVDEMFIEMSSSSEANVRVVSSLEGVLRDTSVLYYQGNPVLNVDCDTTSHLLPLTTHLSILN